MTEGSPIFLYKNFGKFLDNFYQFFGCNFQKIVERKNGKKLVERTDFKMYQQQNYGYYPQTNYTRTIPVGLKGRPVSSIEEVRASAIDFDGSVFYFPDLANKRIYTKQINLDGTALLNMYELKEIPMEMPVNFVTREEFEAAMKQLQSQLSFVAQPAQKETNNIVF